MPFKREYDNDKPRPNSSANGIWILFLNSLIHMFLSMNDESYQHIRRL